jgi:fructose-1,6-bisphosphatase I
MGSYPTLQEHLNDWARGDATKSSASETVAHLARAGVVMARLISRGPLAGDMAGKRGAHADGDTQKELDVLTNTIVKEALAASPVAWMGSEEDEEPVSLNAGAPLVVNVDPLDGSSNIDANVSIGTIFSILPAQGQAPLLQPGRNQIAAGYIIYGPQTAIALSLGEGTHIFWLDPESGEYLLARRNLRIPPTTREYAVNASNFRHWDDAMKAYVLDCQRGAEGPRQSDFNMRWIGSLVADAFRILTRGGVYLYPGDGRQGYAMGRLRLLYEANPIALLVEQAGGACTTGTERMLDVDARSLHQRVPLVFGSKSEVEEIARYYR